MAKVLIVDDDADTRELWARVFVSEGHETLLADDGMSALDAYDVARPHLVVTDLQLADLDGLELITRLRAANPSVGIIAMSGTVRASRLPRTSVPQSPGSNRSTSTICSPVRANCSENDDPRDARASESTPLGATCGRADPPTAHRLGLRREERQPS